MLKWVELRSLTNLRPDSPLTSYHGGAQHSHRSTHLVPSRDLKCIVTSTWGSGNAGPRFLEDLAHGNRFPARHCVMKIVKSCSDVDFASRLLPYELPGLPVDNHHARDDICQLPSRGVAPLSLHTLLHLYCYLGARTSALLPLYLLSLARSSHPTLPSATGQPGVAEGARLTVLTRSGYWREKLFCV